MILETERLELVPLRPHQLRLWIEDIPALENDLKCTYKAEPMEGFFLEIVKGQLAITEKNPDDYLWNSFWFLIRKTDRTVVGSAYFKGPPNQQNEVEIGYGLGKVFEHNGYMTEAVKAMCNWAKTQENVSMVTAETDLDGLASQRILKRCGFVEKTRGETVWWQLDKTLPYRMIYKRKSFHLFRNTGNEKIPQHKVDAIKEACKSFTPLYPAIKTAIRIVPADETTCRRGQEYCILLYSEKKDNYLQNMGYLGEQLDLYLVSQNIGTLWFGIGKTQEPSFNGLDFVIMIAISQIDSEMKFRKDMFKSKRKPEEDIWSGEPIKGVTDIVRFAPSACNTQPWFVEHTGHLIKVFRYKRPGKRGIMPAAKVSYYNRIDIGIFLCFLDLCLDHNDIHYSRELYDDYGYDDEKTLAAIYTIHSKDNSRLKEEQ